MSSTSDTPWRGRSGRSYALHGGHPDREGGMATLRAAVPLGPPVGLSTVPAGTLVALKIARSADALAMESLAREVETFEVLCRSSGQTPCPRLYDVLGTPANGLIMEWCPTDLERWWEGHHRAPRAFVELVEALADVCRRVREYEAILEMDLGRRVIHADIKPKNVLRSSDGRWLLTDFGASKSRSVDDDNWAATRMVLGTENFIAPEAVFNARKPFPAAMDTWSIGCTLLALLKMRTFLRNGARMPPNGTHSHHFRSQRVLLVSDLQERKPALFLNKDLDPALFSSPDRLPDKDRQAVHDALIGVFDGTPQPALERALEEDVTRLLSRALAIDPARRYCDPLELAGDLEGLAQRYRELLVQGVGGDAAPPSPGRPAGVVPGLGEPRATAAEARQAAAADPPTPLAPATVAPATVAPAAVVPAEPPPAVSAPPAAPAPPADPAPRPPTGAPSVSAPPSPRPSSPKPTPVDPSRSSMVPRGAPRTPSTPPAPRPAPPADDPTPRPGPSGLPAPQGNPPAPPAAPVSAVPAPSPAAVASTPSLPPSNRPDPDSRRRGVPGWLVGAVVMLGIGEVLILLWLLILSWVLWSASPSTSPPATTTEIAPAETSPAPASPATAAPPTEAPPAENAATEADPAAAPPAPEPTALPPAEVAAAAPPPAAPTPSATPAPSSPTATKTTTTSPATKAPAKAEPAPAASGTPATVLVTGAEAYLVGPSGKIPVGTVTPGSYELFARSGADTAFVKVSALTLAAGERAVFKCGFGTCRRL